MYICVGIIFNNNCQTDLTYKYYNQGDDQIKKKVTHMK